MARVSSDADDRNKDKPIEGVPIQKWVVDAYHAEEHGQRKIVVMCRPLFRKASRLSVWLMARLNRRHELFLARNYSKEHVPRHNRAHQSPNMHKRRPVREQEHRQPAGKSDVYPDDPSEQKALVSQWGPHYGLINSNPNDKKGDACHDCNRRVGD